MKRQGERNSEGSLKKNQKSQKRDYILKRVKGGAYKGRTGPSGKREQWCLLEQKSSDDKQKKRRKLVAVGEKEGEGNVSKNQPSRRRAIGGERDRRQIGTNWSTEPKSTLRGSEDHPFHGMLKETVE